METTKIFLKNLINTSDTRNKLFQRNLAKTYLQILVLDFIYSHPKYSQLIFYGGSCLAHCFNLSRLSEDLDFVDLKKKIKIKELAADLELFFQKNTDLKVKTKTQKFRIYLKFPVLQELELTEIRQDESNFLFLKIEIFNEFNFCKNYKTEIIPLFKFNRSILIKTFDLPTLMTTKLRAILYRKWEKTDKIGKIFIKAKGRDYFDLMWYLQKNIKPNIKCLEEINNQSVLKEKLLKIIASVDSKSIQLDLESLIKDEKFIKNLSKNIKEILIRETQVKL
ncbi:nucleotidyl transferase AbiEii/AbiGii toxin family protein [Patescibacteria group bacterium]|nr:nucleotidyl transferase AbiEii/AbiGii toxin family protein [Patescibacteria group bacterium]MBU1246982.1 nucleotidyl transferase AbiEii/AbiGii toxin family protein [Patescibacteria group bacterium]MBU1519730.1 nucleotidyl transferase AbiEii/AbiGii toxin family protein [Patescibacteria group bacterium]MBU2010235.1 nucleotidyl transferase AbiEii/AbiGii toxin family protein [Patescibacteria group bacterium]MBU2416529.1 nucleotidyl transferase AbiEii/AbiGii toxin family protein [Patescibacteria 